MPPAAIALVLVAAVLHAAWNVLLKTSGDPLRTAIRLKAVGAIVLVPIAAGAWLAIGRPTVDPAGVFLALGSAVLESLYFLLLAAAYRRGDLSLVYPIARGSGPILAVGVGVGLLGERLVPLAWAGVGALLVGIVLVAQPWRALSSAGAAHRGAILFALATGATIAAYSAVDRVGVRLVEPWLYGAVLAVGTTAFLAVSVTAGRRLGVLAPAPRVEAQQDAFASAGGPRWSRARLDATAGVLAIAAYVFVLYGHSIAPLATVAPLRESGIVIAAAWGSLRLGEAVGGREAGQRIAAAALVVLGAALLALAQ